MALLSPVDYGTSATCRLSAGVRAALYFFWHLGSLAEALGGAERHLRALDIHESTQRECWAASGGDVL